MNDLFRTIFFKEGPGYIYVKALGSGISGSAVLVRNVKNLNLYVRKEAMVPSRMHKHYLEELDYLRAPQVRIVDTVRPIGCYVYKHESLDLAYEVTYWPYYDCGTLDTAIIKARNLEIAFPEVWLAKWLRDMLSVVLDLHRAGTNHWDGHLNNWFLKIHQGESIPRVGLGDWGRAMTRGKYKKVFYDAGCVEDYKFIAQNIDELTKHQEVTARFFKLYTDLRNAVIRFKARGSIEEMEDEMRRIRDRAADLRNIAPRPTRDQENYLVERTHAPAEFQEVSYDAAEDRAFPGLKHYVWVLGNPQDRTLTMYSDKIGKEPYYKHFVGGFPESETVPRSWTVVDDR